jgi:iron complex outermembrane receptor protein
MARVIVVAALVSFLGTCAYAQEEGGVSLEKIVVTSTRSSEDIKNAPNSITVITRQDIESSKVKTIPDMLREEAGIAVKEYSAGNAKQANIDIRGFGENGPSNVLVMVDGRRVTQIDLSGTDWAQIPLSEVERIEVIRGAASVFYGDNACGGVVNIITRSGGGKPAIKVAQEIGSYATYTSKAEASGRFKNLDYYSLARYYQSAGYRNNNDIKAKDFGLKLGVAASDILATKLSLGYHGDTYGLPGPLNDIQLNTRGRRATVFPLDDAQSEDYFGNLTLESDFQERGKIAADLSARVRQVKSNYMSTSFPWQTDNYITTFGFTPKYILDNPFLDHGNKLTVGFDYYEAQDHIKDGQPNAENNVIVISKRSTGTYIFDQFKLLDALTLSPGYRYEHARYNFEQISAAANQQSRQKDFSEQVFTAGLNYAYDKKDSSLYFNFSQSFRFPLVDEFFSSGFPGFGGGGLDTALSPQTADNYEVGVRHNFDKATYVDAALFLMDFKDEIYLDPFTFRNSNYSRTRHEGLECEGKTRFWNKVNLFANYTFTDARFRKGLYSGNKIPAVPQQKWSAGFDVDFYPDLNFSLVTNYVGERYFISDLRNMFPRMAAYTTVDIRLSYAKNGFSAYTGINNVFDEEYYEYGAISTMSNTKNYYPSPQRNFIIGASVKF